MFIFFGIIRFVCCVTYVYIGDGGKCIGKLEVLGLLLVLMCGMKFDFYFLLIFFPWKYHSSILDGLFSFIYFSIFSSFYYSSIFVFSLFSNHSFFVQPTLLPQLLFWTLKRERKREGLQYYAYHCVLCSFVYNVLYDV